MRIYTWQKLTNKERRALLARPGASHQKALQKQVRKIVDDVACNGDAALFRYALRYDGVDLRKLPLRVSGQERKDAYKLIDGELIDALQSVIEIVQKFTEAERANIINTTAQPHPGIAVNTRVSPIDSCALYVPFGKGRFPSMVYMQGIPAISAGVPRITILIPPQRDGSVDPACLVAADLCGIDAIYRVGGAHGIAACAYGTESIPAAAKIIGPGSPVVSTAKQLVAPICDTGAITGPSESMIICDAHADPAALATQILVEAEHGPDSMALLISSDRAVLERSASIIDALIAETPPPRKAYLEAVMKRSLIEVDSLESACTLCNRYAPEHLQLQVDDPQALIPYITCAGEILIGSQTPFSLANYAGGSNAVLPTAGYARSASALSVRDFLRSTAIIEADPAKTRKLRKQVVSLARYEEFYHHARACAD